MQVALMKVLLSIKPQYVDEIVKGNKKYEFRKKIFKKKDEVQEIYIYSTSPVKKIIGYFNLIESSKTVQKNYGNNTKISLA
jgi:type I restriction enzyme S subunit